MSDVHERRTSAMAIERSIHPHEWQGNMENRPLLAELGLRSSGVAKEQYGIDVWARQAHQDNKGNSRNFREGFMEAARSSCVDGTACGVRHSL